MSRAYRVDIERNGEANSVSIFIICEQDYGRYKKVFVLVGRTWREYVVGHSEPTMFLYGNDVIGQDLFIKLVEGLRVNGLIKFVSHERPKNYFTNEPERLNDDEIIIEPEVQITETWKGKIPEGRKLIMEVEER